MAWDKQASKRFYRLNLRLSNLERRSVARERALVQLAERLGTEIDLTRKPTASEEHEMNMVRMTSRSLLQSEEVKSYLSEPQGDTPE